MKALLLTVGSQGDVQPFVALADRLRKGGHEVLLAAPQLFQGLAEAHEIPFAPLGLDMLKVSDAIEDAHGVRQFLRFARALGRIAPDALDAAHAAARGEFDVVVHHPLLPIGHHLAEFAGARSVVALPTPAALPTRAFPSPVWAMPVPFPRASYRMASRLVRSQWGGDLDRWRHETLDLPRRPGWRDPLLRPGGEPATVLHAFSAHVLPRPNDWPAAAHITGYWNLGAREHLPGRRLREFLDAGEPPIFIGFGSTPLKDPQGTAAAVAEAAGRVGARALISGGYKGMRGITSTDRLHVIRSVPHDWLFPRCAAVVHHGGAGTTGTAATCGIPQVITPVGIDQPFWARRMRDLGVAPKAPRLRAISARTLAPALDQVLHDEEIRYRAQDLGRRIRLEDGTGRAVALLTELLQPKLAVQR
ncbi:glycosyltransferase [Actinocorallia longicatena]|uniref:Glycosyltransferase n=1 Tax=Actinocorallia longicatena TaxID=111803 RepID=A0ABP6QI64_9ACTN